MTLWSSFHDLPCCAVDVTACWTKIYRSTHSTVDWISRARRLTWTDEDRVWLSEGVTVAGTIFVGIFVLECRPAPLELLVPVLSIALLEREFSMVEKFTDMLVDKAPRSGRETTGR